MKNKLILAGLCAALALPAAAQNYQGSKVQQSGSVTAGNCTKWLGNNLIADAGATCGGGGGGGSPGGSANSIQYNNTGSFGGIGPTNNAVVVTNGSGVPTESTTLPSGLTIPGYLTGNQTVTLSGDASGSGATAITVTNSKLNGVAYGASPSTNTVPVVTGTNAVTYEAVPNTALANSSMTIAGHSVALGGTQALAASDLSNGVTGSGSVVLSSAPTITGTATMTGNITANGLLTSGTIANAICSDASGHLIANSGANCYAGGGSGTVTSVSVTTANGVSGTVATPTTTPAISLTLGNITPGEVAASGAIFSAGSALTISGAAVATNAALSNYFYVTLTHTASTAVNNPTNSSDGMTITYELSQDSTGSNLVTWGTAFDFGAAGSPTLSTTASAIDLVAFRYSARNSKWLYLGAQLGY